MRAVSLPAWVSGTPRVLPHRSPDQPLLRRTRFRLLAWSALSTFVALLILGSVIYAAVATSLAEASVVQLRSRAESLSNAIASAEAAGKMGLVGGEADIVVSDPGKQGIVFGGVTSGTLGMIMAQVPPGFPDTKRQVAFDQTTVEPPGGTGAGEKSIALGPDEALAIDDEGVAAARRGQTVLHELSANGAPVRVLSQPFSQGGTTGVIQVVGDRTSEVQTLQVLLIVLVAGAVLVLAAALGVGYVYSGRALVPIRESLRRQREFAADASHELRTPLTVVRTSLEHLRRHPEQSVAAAGETIGGIEVEVTRLTALVDDLLLLARTDSGGLEIERNPVDLAEAALEAVDGLASVAGARSTRVELDLEPIAVVGDRARLRQLVSLLLDNALRHGPGGQLIHVRIRGTSAAAVVEVDDQGPGILPRDLPHIFDRFYRAAGAPPGGTGLGLAIAHWIAERHGGSIRAENLPDRGARFTVTLPAG
jgi:signal transduction histidine kinase